MSRHRNIRNIDYDDYYDDYDDDYDDYDDYDDDGYVAPKKQTPKQNNNTTKSKIQQTKQSSTTSKKSSSATTTNKIKIDTVKVSGGTVSIGKTTASVSKDNVKSNIVSIGKTASVSKDSVTLRITPKENDKLPQDVSTASKNIETTEKVENNTELLKQLKENNNHRSKLSMVVLGHVDAGKSTLIGQLLLQLGTIDKRVITKYQKEASTMNKESFALAWVMDEEVSERERGVTMEVGTKHISLENHDICVLDAPGHADFIPSMISGAACADVGLLVVAATIGEFEAGFSLPSDSNTHGGQTREHIILSRGLGVSQLIVAINKLDVISWNYDRFVEIKNKVHEFLLANGFNGKRIRYVPLSGLTGVNVKEKSKGIKGLEWYKNGLTLIEAMNSYLPAQRNYEKPLRVLVSDVYQEGRFVTTRGRIIQGLLHTNDKVVVLPIGDEATIQRIENQTSTNNKYAIAGDTVQIILNGIDAMRITTGCILCHSNTRVPLKNKFIAQVVIMENLQVPIICGAQVLLHMHSIDVPATISKLISVVGKKHSKRPPRVLTAGVNATVEIRTLEMLCLEEFKECRSLGRFVLRRSGDTIAVGVIEKLL